jgi:hypothetical protein
MVGRVAVAAALCMASQAAFGQYQPQPRTSAVGTSKVFCSGYEQALAIGNRAPGQTYQRPPAGCFAVSPDVIVTILQSYPKLSSGGAIWQVQLGHIVGFLAFSLAPSIPPVAAIAKPPAKVVPQPEPTAPTTKPSDGAFATASQQRSPPAGDTATASLAPVPVTPSPQSDKPKVTQEGAKTAALSTAAIAALIVRDSRQNYYASGHPCACPDDLTRTGRRCGNMSAYVRPGGAAPLCNVSDVSAEMIARYRANAAPTALAQ